MGELVRFALDCVYLVLFVVCLGGVLRGIVDKPTIHL